MVQEPPAGALPVAPRGRVLIIDDEPLVSTSLRRALGRDHDIELAASAAEALELLAHDRFDLILCDLMMPEMTGMDLHAELVRAGGDLADRMVFITGGAFTAAAREFLDRVPNSRLEKPCNISSLRILIGDRLRRP